MTQDTDENMANLHARELKALRACSKGPLPPSGRTIHFTKLQPDLTDSPIAAEWNFYCGQVGRLLSEGHEGKWVLIHDQQLVGIWITPEEAQQAQMALKRRGM